MRLATISFFQHRPRTRSLTLWGTLGIFVLLVPAAYAQKRNDHTGNTSDLGVQNLSRVAASAAELKAVLLKDPGLMVELKRWVAKDATDHGQIVGDTDLSNYAIFD